MPRIIGVVRYVVVVLLCCLFRAKCENHIQFGLVWNGVRFQVLSFEILKQRLLQEVYLLLIKLCFVF